MRRHSVRHDDGAAAVEFALVVLPLLFLVFGIINFGLLFTSQISLNSAARDSARTGVVAPLAGSASTCSAIAVNAWSEAGSLGSPGTRISVTVTGPTGTTCSLPAGASTALQAAASVTGAGSSTPCTGATSASNQLTVLVSNAYKSLVPLIPPATLTQTSTGKFQCEYS